MVKHSKGLPARHQSINHSFDQLVNRYTHRFNSHFSGKPGLASSLWFSVYIDPYPEHPHRTGQNSSYPPWHNPIRSSLDVSSNKFPQSSSTYITWPSLNHSSLCSTLSKVFVNCQKINRRPNDQSKKNDDNNDKDYNVRTILLLLPPLSKQIRYSDARRHALTLCVCLSAALVSTAKLLCRIQCSLVRK